jgi:hypothetical protein
MYSQRNEENESEINFTDQDFIYKSMEEKTKTQNFLDECSYHSETSYRKDKWSREEVFLSNLGFIVDRIS